MIVELSDQDIEIISQWYSAAAGESVSIDGSNPAPWIALIRRLGLIPHPMDEKFFA